MFSMFKNFMTSTKVPDVAAIDFGSSTIKICQIGGTLAAPELLKIATYDTPAMTVKDGCIVGSQALGDAVRSAMVEQAVKCKRLTTSVSGQQVVLRPIVMTRMSEKELNQAIRFEAEKYLPYAVGDAQISAKIINQDAGDGKNNMEVLLIAVPNDIVNNSREVIKLAQIEPGAIDLEPLALQRATKHCCDPNINDSTLAILNLGASSSQINIFREGVLRHNRTIPVAGNSFTKAIGQSLNLSFEEAEKVKKDKAVIRVEDDKSPLPPLALRIFGVISPVLTELLTDLQRSFDFYRTRYKLEKVDNIVLCGGTANLKNLDKFLAASLKTHCEIANPFKKIGTSKLTGVTPETLLQLAPSSMVVVGLALRELA